MHCISTIIFKESDFKIDMPYVKLNKGLGMVEHTDDNMSVISRLEIPFITIYTDYFGGVGEQGSTYYPITEPGETSINEGLRKLGVMKDDKMDEFDTVGLGRYRSNSDLFENEEDEANVLPKYTIKREKVGNWDAMVCTEENGTVCIALDGPGGAVIAADNYLEAETRFIEAMHLAESVKKLLYFKEHGKFPQ
jgi:hypothetical protein